jgi:HlyD family secretion protein
MKKRSLFIILAVLLTLIASYVLWNQHLEKRNYINVYGNVDVRQVDLGFRVQGRVTELIFEEGDIVQPSRLMASIEKKPYSDKVLEAAAQVKSTEYSLENAKKILQRRCELISTGSISQEDLDDSLTSFEVYASKLKEFKATLAIAEKNLSDTEIYCPTRGTILTRIREPGSVVNSGEPVYTLSISSPVWIRAFIPEPSLGLVYPGMKGEIITDTPGGKIYTGTVGYISPVSEFTPKYVETTELRTDLVYRIRLYADNPDLGLRQGQPVTVKLSFKNHKETPVNG